MSPSPSHSASDHKKSERPQSSSPTTQSPETRSRASTREANEFYSSLHRDTPQITPGIVDTTVATRMVRTSSTSSETLRIPKVDDDETHTPKRLRDSEKIRQLELTVVQQNEYIRETMQRMRALEMKYENKNSD